MGNLTAHSKWDSLLSNLFNRSGNTSESTITNKPYCGLEFVQIHVVGVDRDQVIRACVLVELTLHKFQLMAIAKLE